MTDSRRPQLSELMLTLEEVKTALKLGSTSVANLIRSGELPSVMIGGCRRVRVTTSSTTSTASRQTTRSGPRATCWWWLRYWLPAMWLVGTGAGVAVWRLDAPAAAWNHVLAVAALFGLLLGAAVMSR